MNTLNTNWRQGKWHKNNLKYKIIMKTRFLLLGAMLLSLCCFTSCNDDENLDGPAPDVIWDIYPFGISIEVTDAEGNDLLPTKVSK